MANANHSPVAVVTGGAQGIGKGIALHLLEAGWRVVLADRDQAAGAESEAELAPAGEVLFVPTDVSSETDVERCIDAVRQRFGRLDGLVNNAGFGIPRQAVENLELETWDRVLATNLTGAFLLVKHSVPLLRAAGGAIVNIASTRALQSEPQGEAYAASKGGLLALTHALAVSLGPAIRVNCICPGWIEVGDWRPHDRRETPRHSVADREQHPVGRVGTPHDVAELTLFLLSSRAGFMTGQAIPLDGGMTRKMIYV